MLQWVDFFPKNIFINDIGLLIFIYIFNIKILLMHDLSKKKKL